MTTTELVPVDQTAPVTLFATNDPKEIIASATAKANALAEVVRSRKLASNIQGREYVKVEGWTLLGSLMGVFPVCAWTRPTENGWEARVEARTLDDRLVGAAEAQCERDEPTWAKRSSFALRSMAQTRVTSKALRLPLGFVMALAGFEATPAEEMDGAVEGEVVSRSQPQSARQAPRPAADPRNQAQARGDADLNARLAEWWKQARGMGYERAEVLAIVGELFGEGKEPLNLTDVDRKNLLEELAERKRQKQGELI